MQHLMG